MIVPNYSRFIYYIQREIYKNFTNRGFMVYKHPRCNGFFFFFFFLCFIPNAHVGSNILGNDESSFTT